MTFHTLLETSYLARYILLNAVDINDYRVFPARDIQNVPPVYYFSSEADQNRLLPVLDDALHRVLPRQEHGSFDKFFEVNGTTAFLIIHHDRLLLESYFNGYSHDSICTSFSTVKSFVSAMIGIAVNERLISGIDDPLTTYLPEFSSAHIGGITIRHLVSMSSGLSYKQGVFLPWSDDPRVYYSTDLRKTALRANKVEPPGTRFNYNNYNLLLLGMIIERVTGDSVSYYLQEKIWKPLGMEFPASWSLDSQQSGMEKMESGLNARAIDYAKFARLYLRRGDWDGRQVVPESWVVESTTVAPEAKWTNYKYLWWIPRSGHNRFMAVGNLGQFIYIAPDRDCIILRFGKGKPKNWQKVYVQLFGAIADAL